MKKAFLFILALLLLSACGAPAAEPVETPSESAAPVTGPQEEAYTFTSTELALSFPVSEELAPKIAIKQGVDFFDEGGDSLSICLIMPDSDELDTVLTTLVKVPRLSLIHISSISCKQCPCPDTIKLRAAMALVVMAILG